MYKFSAKTEQMLKFGGWHPDTVLDQNFQQCWQEQGFYLGKLAQNFLECFGGVVIWEFVENNNELEVRMCKHHNHLNVKGRWKLCRSGGFFDSSTSISNSISMEIYHLCCSEKQEIVSPLGYFSEYLVFASKNSFFAALNRAGKGKLFMYAEWFSIQEMLEEICENSLIATV
jgi:hypothetical protein